MSDCNSTLMILIYLYKEFYQTFHSQSSLNIVYSITSDQMKGSSEISLHVWNNG